MNNSPQKNSLHTSNPLFPVAVGGVGGSGSRLIAQLLMELGLYMGDDLNDAKDNLWFTLLFKRIEILSIPDSEFNNLVEIFINGMVRSRTFTWSEKWLIYKLAVKSRAQHPNAWLKPRASSLSSVKPLQSQIRQWGWKEPNTHIVIDRLLKIIPNLKYIHVVRNGLDMAYSSNQNQLQLWGAHFLGENCQISPYYSLRYWCIVHRRIQAIGKAMGPNFLFLNFDKLCQSPRAGVKKLASFLEMDISNIQADVLAKLVKRPASIGRYKRHDMTVFSSSDLAYLDELGFDTSI